VDCLNDLWVAILELVYVGSSILYAFTDLIQHVFQMVLMHWEKDVELLDYLFTSLDKDCGDFIDKIYLMDDCSCAVFSHNWNIFEAHQPVNAIKFEETTKYIEISDFQTHLIIAYFAA
jgi:hypothetical protein